MWIELCLPLAILLSASSAQLTFAIAPTPFSGKLSSSADDVARAAPAQRQQVLADSTATVVPPPTRPTSASLVTLSSAGAKAAELVRVKQSLRDAEEQLKSKTHEVQVQSELAQEKQQAAAKELSRVAELRRCAEKLQKEADVAAEIAAEKSAAATKVEQEERQLDGKVATLRAEENETDTLLMQMRREEAALASEVGRLRENWLMKSAAIRQTHSEVQQHDRAEVRVPLAGKRIQAKAQMALAAKSYVVVDIPDRDAVRKLLEENRRLRAEKDALQAQLKLKNVAHEKSVLKAHLRNKLADADRHAAAHGATKHV